MERIDRRVPIKVIASELGISETRINQHIRALKNSFDAGSLSELVENYRASLDQPATLSVQEQQLNEFFSIGSFAETDRIGPGYSPGFGSFERIVVAGERDLSPGLRSINRPKVAQGILDGRGALRLRFGAIASFCILFAAATILAVEAGQALGVSLAEVGDQSRPQAPQGS